MKWYWWALIALILIIALVFLLFSEVVVRIMVEIWTSVFVSIAKGLLDALIA